MQLTNGDNKNMLLAWFFLYYHCCLDYIAAQLITLKNLKLKTTLDYMMILVSRISL